MAAEAVLVTAVAVQREPEAGEAEGVKNVAPTRARGHPPHGSAASKRPHHLDARVRCAAPCLIGSKGGQRDRTRWTQRAGAPPRLLLQRLSASALVLGADAQNAVGGRAVLILLPNAVSETSYERAEEAARKETSWSS